MIVIAQRNYNVSPPAQVEVERDAGETTGIWVIFGIILLLIFGYFLFFASRNDPTPASPTIEQNQQTTPAPTDQQEEQTQPVPGQ